MFFSRLAATFTLGLVVASGTFGSTVFANENSSIEVTGESHVLSCPGYFSSAVFNGSVTYKVAASAGANPQSVELVYSLRDAWNVKSWAIGPQIVTLSTDNGSFWTATLPELTVDERGHLHMSHLELAVKIIGANGETTWDNGGLAPLGFYSVALPQPSCTAGAQVLLAPTPMASASDYR